MHAWFWPPLITWKYLTGKKGKSVQITKPILEVEVDKQRKLNPGTLKLWVRFDRNVEFQSKKLVPNLDTTNLTVDPALAVVGRSSKDADELSQHGQKES